MRQWPRIHPASWAGEARICGGASAAHSPIAVNDRAPASTAAAAVSNNDVSVCRTPRGSPWDLAPAPGTQQARAPAGQQRAITGGQVLKLLQGRTDQG
jgi:hypothetical protein